MPPRLAQVENRMTPSTILFSREGGHASSWGVHRPWIVCNNIPYVQVLTINKKVIIIPTSTNQLPTQKNICSKYHFCSNRYLAPIDIQMLNEIGFGYYHQAISENYYRRAKLSGRQMICLEWLLWHIAFLVYRKLGWINSLQIKSSLETVIR